MGSQVAGVSCIVQLYQAADRKQGRAALFMLPVALGSPGRGRFAVCGSLGPLAVDHPILL